jgi:hypothetical protein
MNCRVYIDKFIDITGRHRADCMQRMTANWSPIDQEERDQLCYGVRLRRRRSDSYMPRSS